jgi:hypothetical protein
MLSKPLLLGRLCVYRHKCAFFFWRFYRPGLAIGFASYEWTGNRSSLGALPESCPLRGERKLGTQTQDQSSYVSDRMFPSQAVR